MSVKKRGKYVIQKNMNNANQKKQDIFQPEKSGNISVERCVQYVCPNNLEILQPKNTGNMSAKRSGKYVTQKKRQCVGQKKRQMFQQKKTANMSNKRSWKYVSPNHVSPKNRQICQSKEAAHISANRSRKHASQKKRQIYLPETSVDFMSQMNRLIRQRKEIGKYAIQNNQRICQPKQASNMSAPKRGKYISPKKRPICHLKET